MKQSGLVKLKKKRWGGAGRNSRVRYAKGCCEEKSTSSLQMIDDSNENGLYYIKNAPEHHPCFLA